MIIYLQSLNFEFWSVVIIKYSPPTLDFSVWDEYSKKRVNLNSKAMNALYCSLDKTGFFRISTYTSVYEM